MLMLMMSMMIMMMMEIRLGEKAKKKGGDLDKHVTKLAGCMEAKSF